MPYRMKNRFLVLGITGPLGAGCTTTAKFLSGKRLEGPTVISLIDSLIHQTDDLTKRVDQYYNQIENIRESIDNRLSKNLGPYKQALLNAQEDPKVQAYERQAKKAHEHLKIYLRRREVTDVLEKFLVDKVVDYHNINELDKDVFGIQPFVYLSFTSVIMKLAFETFHGHDGRRKYNAYFKNKIKFQKDIKSKDSYEKICFFLRNEFVTLKKYYKKKYIKASQYIQEKDYLLFKKSSKLSAKLKEEIDKKNQSLVKEFYSYFKEIINIQKRLKDFVAQQNGQEYNNAISDILQDWGDNCRAKANPFLELSGEPLNPDSLFTLSEEINSLIKFLRYRLRFLDKNFRIYEYDENATIPSLFVVECFRNPFEVEFFRSRYAEFYLLSISADLPIRKKRVKYFSHLREKRDQGDAKKPYELHKLDVRSCVLNSDIALRNNRRRNESLINFFEKLMRYFALIRSPGCITPTDDELYMHLAYAHSLKSNCISRKVGAIILGPKGYILGAGWNDVGEGQVGCGLRHKRDYLNIESIPMVSSDEDIPRFMELLEKSSGNHVCFKDITSKLQISKKIKKFKEDKTCNNRCLEKIENEMGIKRLEYCRALHAEENALLQITKVGGMPIKGGTLYTTTYPCELCAKKLYQTGIRTIYYTEPYPESIADEVFFKDGIRTIERIPFEGVKSHSYFRLFKPIYDKKELSEIESNV